MLNYVFYKFYARREKYPEIRKMISNMNTFFDYYVMLNYVVYKFYRRNEKKEIDAKSASVLLSSLYLSLPFSIIHGFLCMFSHDFLLASRQCNRLIYIIPLLSVCMINYFILYNRDKYKDVFQKLDKISDTDEFVRRKRNTKTIIISLVVIQLVALIH